MTQTNIYDFLVDRTEASNQRLYHNSQSIVCNSIVAYVSQMCKQYPQLKEQLCKIL